MSERFPDIEVYVLKPEINEIYTWLNANFKQVEEKTSSAKSVLWLADGIEVLFTANSNKNFASVWFKNNQTPWNNDLECGWSLHLALDKEVRCSNAAWQENEEGAAWTKLIRGEEKALNWD